MDSVRQEYAAMRFAATYSHDAAFRNPTVLPYDADFEIRDSKAAADSLEATYVVRLFAEFEAGLRSYWSTVRPTSPPVSALIDAVAARAISRIVADASSDVHEVRVYRNAIVHEGDDAPKAVPLDESHRRLKLYLLRLPWDW
jgi:hypothetical protein